MVDDPVEDPRDRRVGKREALRDGDARHVQGLLAVLGRGIGENEQDGLVDDCGSEAKRDVARDVGDERAHEGVVPVVPDVHVHGLREVREHQDEVDDERQRDDDEANRGAQGNCGAGGPAHVDRGELQAKAVNHLLDGRSDGGAEQLVDDEVQADEANTDHEAGLQALAKPSAQAADDDRNDDRHHD